MTARDELPEEPTLGAFAHFQEWKAYSAALRARCEELEKERDEALSDPMNAGWEHAKAARADRESALSQWKKERQLREQAEAKLAEREKDAARYHALIGLLRPGQYIQMRNYDRTHEIKGPTIALFDYSGKLLGYGATEDEAVDAAQGGGE